MSDSTNGPAAPAPGIDRTPTYDFEDDVAIVVGSSRGIGAAIAKRLAADGASVVVTYYNRDGQAQEVVDEINAGVGEAFAVQVDVTEREDVENVYDEAESEFGEVDTVVNLAKAGIYLDTIADFSEDEFDEIYDVHAKGHFFVLQEAATRVADNGSIVLVSSVGTTGMDPTSPHGPHLGSKAAAEFMIAALAEEVGERGITANSVSPGTTKTEGLTLPPGMEEKSIERTPLGRIGYPEDVADVVAFLASDDARWLTAQNLVASGGLGPYRH